MPASVEMRVGEEERRMWPEVVERRRRDVGGRSWRRVECRVEMGVLDGRGSVKFGRPGKVLMSALMMWGAMIAVEVEVEVEVCEVGGGEGKESGGDVCQERRDVAHGVTDSHSVQANAQS